MFENLEPDVIPEPGAQELGAVKKRAAVRQRNMFLVGAGSGAGAVAVIAIIVIALMAGGPSTKDINTVGRPEVPTTPTSVTPPTTTAPAPAPAETPGRRSDQAAAQSPTTVPAPLSGPPVVFARNSESAFEVWMMNADGSGARRVDSFPQPKPDPPACGSTWPIAHNLGDWSPDGSRFFVLSRCPGTDAVIYDRTGRRLQRFRVSDDSGLTDAAWSPDGSQLASDDEGKGTLAIYEATTGRVVRQFEGFASHYIGWAPSSRIALVGFKLSSPDRSVGLFTVDPSDGGSRRVASAQFQGRPQWSPDGRILFRYSDPSRSSSMGVARDVSDADVTKLCGDAGDFDWSPDYRSVVAAVLDRAGPRVRICPATGGPSTAELAAGTNPGFDSDGSVLYSAEGKTWTVNADGTGRRPLATGGPAIPAPN